MKLWLVSNIRLDPGQGLRASAIQNLRTAIALAEEGHEILVWCDRLFPDAEPWLETRLGAALPRRCRLLEAPAHGKRGEKRTALSGLWNGWKNLSSAKALLPEPAAIISRSPAFLRRLRASRLRPRNAKLIHELQYPEWSFLWRDWAQRNKGYRISSAVPELRRVKALEREGYLASDGILYAASAHRRLLERAGYCGPARWIPSACEEPAGRPDSVEPDFHAGFVGTLAPENGLECFIDAVADIPECRAAILGDGSRDYVTGLRERAKIRKAGDRIQFIGRVSPSDVRPWMWRCRVGVVPLSRRCGPEKRLYASPLKLIEWMGAGVPVLASDVPSILQHISAGDPIRTFAADEPGNLAVRLRTMLADPPGCAAIGLQALDRAGRRTFRSRARLIADFVAGLDKPGAIP